MDIHAEPRPVPRDGGWLRWGMLGALLYLLWQPTPIRAQSGSIPAYTPTYELSVTLPNDDDTVAVVAGDLNGDGALDLVMSNHDSPDIFYLNDGRGRFDAGTPFGSATSGHAIALADMDGDGDLDILTSGEQSVLYENDGDAHFASQSSFSVPWFDPHALGDIDGDGDFDLVAAGAIWRNDGQGHLTATAPFTDTARALVDFDGDGDLDLVAARGKNRDDFLYTELVAFYTNDGTGTFTERALTLAPPYDLTDAAAFGDLDGDGRLDLVLSRTPSSGASGSNPEALVLYRQPSADPALPADSPQWLNEINGAAAIELADLDRDGDLDIVTSGLLGLNPDDYQGYLYLNEGVDAAGLLQFRRVPWGPNASGNTLLLADLNGDGIDEIVVGQAHFDAIYSNHSQPNFDTCSVLPIVPAMLIDIAGDGDLDLLYHLFASDNPGGLLATHNDGAGNFRYDQATGISIPYQVPYGTADLNADGLDDLIIVYRDQPAQIYLQAGDGTFTLRTSLPAAAGAATTLATGDLDGDGDLDLVLGQAALGPFPDYQPRTSPNQIYLNQGDGTFGPALPLGTASDDTASLALADLDNDGNLDIVVANGANYPYPTPQQNYIYWNRGNWATPGAEHFVVSAVDTTPRSSSQVVVGDFNGDGFTDFVLVDAQKSESIFLNRGDRTFQRRWLTPLGDQANGLLALDLDLDGDLDLLTSDNHATLRNDGQGAFAWYEEFPGVPQAVGSGYLSPYLVGDLNGDGLADVIARHQFAISILAPPCLALQTRDAVHPPPPAHIQLLPLDNTVLAGPYASPHIFAAGAITFTYTLFDPTASPADVRGFYSLDGGGKWLPAKPTAATALEELATLISNQPVTHTYTWDVLGSSFFGQSDRVVFRLEARADLHPRRNGVSGPYRRPYQAAQSYPLRVRGTQVRVVDPAGVPMPAALLYRLPATVSGAAMPFAATSTSAPFRTNSQGYLSGRAGLTIGDRLVALTPITATESYTLYYTSATPTLTGLNFYTVTSAGVQTLTVSAANPLLLFNLEVALEWDARKDTAFLNQLEFDLRRTAEFLFDATDGQAALGEITLYHNKENWAGADLRIYASNALIPNADPGGIVRSETSEIIANNPFIGATTPYSITYQPGAIRMGAVWNRYGEATGTLGEDWPRTLAHEIGHYAFYLYDNYLGLKDGVVVPVDDCTGTLMSDQYREDYSEFRTVDTWATACGQTVSAQRSGRADWQTITRFYPWLKMPSGPANPGPVTLPLAVTQIESRFATTPTQPLDVAVFDLVNPVGAVQTSGPHAQAVLYSQERLIDLGHPVVDKLEARGAHVGDRLCIYDLPEKRLGCETITANDNFLTLASRDDWQPEIVVSPVTSRTVSVWVSNVAAGVPLKGKLYPENSPATTEIAFVPWPGNSYSTTFQLATGVLAGHIQIWVEEAANAQNPRRESLTSYALGGSPGKLKKPPKGNKRSLELTEQSGSQEATPAIAPDGQVLIYGNVSFTDGEFYALQKVNRLPVAPLWTTVVGDGYRILKSAKAPDLVNTSILFRYRGQDVPAGEESFLSLYFWEEAKAQWRKLPTVLNRAVNEASAQAPGPGLYVLMSSLEIPIRRIGWNLVAYPVQETRPVTAALASLGSGYSTVYGYVDNDAADPWKVYDPLAPVWVNDLAVLAFGQGYWINVTQPITWLVKGPDDNAVQTAAATLPTPPATYYGAVLPGRGLLPAASQPVQALINGAVCGESITQAVAGQIVYSLNVEGDGATDPNCVGLQQRVVITVAGLPLEVVFWQNDVVQMVGINGPKYFFPIIRLRHRGQ